MPNITNVANVRYNYTGARAVEQTTSNTTDTLVTNASSMSITKTAIADGFRVGGPLSYVLRVENTGSTALTNVEVVDNLGAYVVETETRYPLTYVEGTAITQLNNGVWTQTTPTLTQPLTISIGSLAAGDVVNIVYSTNVGGDVDLETITNNATVSGSNGTDTITATDTETVDRLNYADIVVNKAGSSSTITTGQPFFYTLTIENNGNIDATDLVVTDNLPDNFSLASIVMTQDGVTTTLQPTDYTFAGGLLTVPSVTSSLNFVVSPTGSPTNGPITLVINGSFTE